MLDWHTFQICYPVEIKLLLLLLYVSISVYLPVFFVFFWGGGIAFFIVL